MSWLSSLTGIHISPHGVSVEPGKLIADVGALALPGVGGLASHIPGVGAAAGALGHLPGVASIAGLLGIGGGGAAPGDAGVPLPNTSTLGTLDPTTGQMIPPSGGAAPAAGGSPGFLQSIENLLAGHAGASAPQALGGVVGAIGGFLGGNHGMNALGVAQGVNQAMLQKAATNYAKQGLGTAMQSYTERAPLRAAGIAGMLNPATPSLNDLTQLRSQLPMPGPAPVSLGNVLRTGNPYATGAPVGAQPTPAPMPIRAAA